MICVINVMSLISIPNVELQLYIFRKLSEQDSLDLMIDTIFFCFTQSRRAANCLNQDLQDLRIVGFCFFCMERGVEAENCLNQDLYDLRIVGFCFFCMERGEEAENCLNQDLQDLRIVEFCFFCMERGVEAEKDGEESPI